MFAGGGMARLGLGENWQCLLANDIDAMKCKTYRKNFGSEDLIENDIHRLDVNAFPQARADLMWGSFPCQDLSLAGPRAGIAGPRSGAFFGFWRIFEDLHRANCAPRIIALENVTGLLTSNGGADFSTIATRIANAGYRVSAVIIDAVHFTPQSRPRLFIFGFAPDLASNLRDLPTGKHQPMIERAQDRLPETIRASWIDLPIPDRQRTQLRLADIIDHRAENWLDDNRSNTLLTMMAPAQRARIAALIKHKATRFGTGFRRTRRENGVSVQRFEVRFDNIAGCLRTPAGGSSRQFIIAVDNGQIRIRLMSGREAARLMGIDDDYALPTSATAALKICGDGVCVPVVKWIGEHILQPALSHDACALASCA